MAEDYLRQSPVLSWPIMVSACVYTLIVVFVFNDYMQNVPGEYVSVSAVEATAPQADYVLPVPTVDYAPHRDGDVLNVGP